MDSMNDFPWNGNEKVTEHYQKKNYRVIQTKAKTKKAIIFFSSNGIYFPNQEDIFVDAIEKEDRYEWQNLAKHRRIRKYYEKIIFVRDIYKQWYMTGINSELSDVDKLVAFFQKELDGYQITTCGSSAGGYMSALMGILLDADRIFVASGQFNIYYTKPFLDLYREDESKNKYFDLVKYIEKKKEDIFYFYPLQSPPDLEQNELIKHIPVNRFPFHGEKHGTTMDARCYPYILSAEKPQLVELHDIYQEKEISKEEFYQRVIPLMDRIYYDFMHNLKSMVKRILKRQNIY